MGSGNCQFYAPGTFDMDAECKAVLLEPPGDSREAIRSAAEGCPTRAIEIAEDPS